MRLRLAVAAALLLAGCSPPQPSAMPLFDDGAAPDVLVEARALAPPPATGGNRFLTGWTAVRGGTARLLRPDPRGARLEAVHLGTSPRRLVLAFEPPADAGAMTVSIAGGPSRSMPLAPRVEVPLPGGLPPGRFVVDLRFAAPAPLLRGAGFDRASPAGAVTLKGGELRQAGVSRVELVRPLDGEAWLVGELAPPAGGRDEQRFELRVRRRDGDQLLWSWQRRWWPAGRQRLRLRVRGEDGWLRLALVAATPGPPATWRGLALAAAPAAPAAGPPASPRPAPPAPAPPLPAPQVVVLYVFDALRADAVGARAPDGGSATPTLDGLAAGGARFTAHFTVAPNTLPATKALLTGRVWRQHGGVALGPTPTTLAERFRAAGYRTGLFSGNVYVSRAYGVDRGFEAAPESTIFGAGAELAHAYNDNAATVHREALAWLATLPAGARAFLYLHVVHPHNPYRPPPPLAARFDDSVGATLDGSTATLLSLAQRRLAATPADRRRLRALYHAGLAYADGELRHLLAALHSRYPREQVLVAITADHGEELFDHGGVLHGYTLYDEMLRIPLLLNWPGRLPPRAVARTTSTVDLHGALAALAGGDSPTSLWTLLRDPAPPDSAAARELHLAAAASVRGGIFAARTPRYKVVWAPRTGGQWGQGQGWGRTRDPESVFDLRADPTERHNLAGLDTPEVLWLRSRLLAWATAPDPDAAVTEPRTDEETRARLRALGYVE